MTTDEPSIAIYDHHHDAEDAVKALQKAGFDMRKLSIIGKNYHSEEHVLGYLNMGDRVKLFGKWGAIWGGLFGLLLGSALLVIPVFGTLVVLGPLASTIAGAVEGAVAGGGVSALVAALTSIGVPKDSIVQYEAALKAEKFLLVVHGTAAEVEQARGILRTVPPDAGAPTAGEPTPAPAAS